MSLEPLLNRHWKQKGYKKFIGYNVKSYSMRGAIWNNNYSVIRYPKFLIMICKDRMTFTQATACIYIYPH